MRVVRIASAAVVLAAVGVLASASTAKPFKFRVEVVSVRAFPVFVQRGTSKGVLDPAKLNVVSATNGLAFRVVVHNVSAAKQTNVHVVLQVSRSAAMGGPIVHQVTLGTIPANNTRAVTFTNVGKIPFASRTSLVVSVPHGLGKVYPVIFSLPG